jgi:hypothetical protein
MPIDETTLQLWWHYEETAIHFNELIMQYRLQLMGATGAIGAVTAFVISHKSNKSHFHELRAFTATIVTILFSAAAWLDLFYYNELLLGAVDALLALEARHPELNLSTAINNRFDASEANVISWSYGLLITLMAGFSFWSSKQWWAHRNTQTNNR